MDDIAREQGMSKKTIYKYFSSKKELVNSVAREHNEAEKKAITEIQNSTENAIQEMVEISRYVNNILKGLNPSIIFDLKKYYRASWQMFESLHNDFVYSVMKNNMEQGQKESLYRNDFDADMLARFYTGMALIITEQDIFPRETYSKELIYNSYIDYHMKAIMTPKGLELYLKYKDQWSNTPIP